MKYITLYFLLIIAINSRGQSSSDAQTRQRLSDLVKERKDRFEAFNEAIETRSGIFGNQTKKDLKAANEVLREIVKTDNRIIFELQRLLDHKSFEKTEKSFQQKEKEVKLEKYLVAIDNLNKKNKELTEKNKDLSVKSERSSLVTWITLIFTLAIIIYLLIRIRHFKKKLNLI